MSAAYDTALANYQSALATATTAQQAVDTEIRSAMAGSLGSAITTMRSAAAALQSAIEAENAAAKVDGIVPASVPLAWAGGEVDWPDHSLDQARFLAVRLALYVGL